MPGAGSARAAGFIAKVAPKDGTVIANIMPGAVIGPMLDPKAEKLFDPTQVMYIGNVNNGVRVCVSGGTSKIKTFDDARTMKAVFGGAAGERFHPRLRLSAPEDHRRDLGHGRSATRARPIFRSRSNAARSTGSAASTGRA